MLPRSSLRSPASLWTTPRRSAHQGPVVELSAALGLGRKRLMLEMIGAGQFMGAWLDLWELALDSPTAGTALAALLFSMATAGIGLAVFGGRERQAPAQTVAVVVQAPRVPRRVRRRR